MSVFLILSSVIIYGYAADAEITEVDTYVLNRDGNGESLYLYQSPCMIGYDLNNQYGGNGVPIQAFVFTMYKSATVEVGNSPMRQPLNRRHGNNSFYINRFTSYACFPYFPHYKKTNINRSITKSVAEN